MAYRDKLIPVVVAFPLFLQNLDTSVMATALPSIAASLQVDVLHLNLAITSYLLSLAVFLPLSGWLADRFGAKRVFCCAIACFATASALCGAANSLGFLVIFRIFQGLGGAMMVPVGRLILLRSVQPSAMVAAMVWFTVPPTMGRMVGPVVGGLIVTWTSWRWIFLINVPLGLLGIALAAWLLDDRADERIDQPLDLIGFLLLAVGLTGVLGGLEVIGKSLVAGWITGASISAGVLSLGIYVWRNQRRADPIIDLRILRFPGYFASIVGGTPLRVAMGASPFLLPLMFQVGFGLSPLRSGLLTVATAIGSMATRLIVTSVIHRIGFRSLLMASTLLTGLCYMSYGLFEPDTPHALMVVAMLFGGLVNSMGMISMQTLGFSAIPRPLMSHATALSTMGQQVSLSLGVVLAASLVTVTAHWHGNSPSAPAAQDFSAAFIAIGLMTMLSLLFFRRLTAEEGSELR